VLDLIHDGGQGSLDWSVVMDTIFSVHLRIVGHLTNNKARKAFRTTRRAYIYICTYIEASRTRGPPSEARRRALAHPSRGILL
jgi:hypothetical protein